MAHTSKDPTVHRGPEFDQRREDAWKQAPSREVTNDRGTNVEPDPEHRRHESSTANPDRGPAGGDPKPTGGKDKPAGGKDKPAGGKDNDDRSAV